MSALQADANQPAVVTFNGRLYGYGASIDAAWMDFRRNIMGGSRSMQIRMLAAASVQPISDEEASEVEEMLAADVLVWS